MARDKRRVDAIDRPTNFVLLDPKDWQQDIDKVTSVAVIPFMPDGRIMATILPRGIDIPGGHMHDDETTLEQTARREAYEEAAIHLSDLHPVGVIQSDYFGNAPEDLTYMVIMTGLVTKVDDFTPTNQELGREIVTLAEFAARYPKGSIDLAALAVKAKALCST